MKGYLIKYNGLLKRSKQKFFELTEQSVCYYKEEGLSTPHKVFPLQGCTVSYMDGYLGIREGENETRVFHENASYLQKWHEELVGAIEAFATSATRASRDHLKLKRTDSSQSWLDRVEEAPPDPERFLGEMAHCRWAQTSTLMRLGESLRFESCELLMCLATSHESNWRKVTQSWDIQKKGTGTHRALLPLHPRVV